MAASTRLVDGKNGYQKPTRNKSTDKTDIYYLSIEKTGDNNMASEAASVLQEIICLSTKAMPSQRTVSLRNNTVIQFLSTALWIGDVPILPKKHHQSHWTTSVMKVWSYIERLKLKTTKLDGEAERTREGLLKNVDKFPSLPRNLMGIWLWGSLEKCFTSPQILPLVLSAAFRNLSAVHPLIFL